ncbi:MAG: NUDIX hydrolase [Nocardioidaceae bacterium]
MAAAQPGSGTSQWTVYGERTIYSNPWVSLALADVQVPSGERFEHHVVRMPQASILVVLDERERVLLMWRHRFIADRWGWELPGGVVDDDEDPAVTAARETEEETGWRPRSVRHVVTFQPMVGTLDSLHHVYIAPSADKVGDPTGEAEAERVAWVPLDDVLGLIRDGKIWNSGTLVGLLHLLASRVSL